MLPPLLFAFWYFFYGAHPYFTSIGKMWSAGCGFGLFHFKAIN
jgi:hypothetical protein